MDKSSKYTKLKIISGYALLFLLSVFAILFIYKQITKLSVEGTETNTNRKLFLTGNTLTGLYEAEALSNAFVQTGTAAYFNKYLKVLQEVEDNIDTLKNLTTNLTQQLRIDSIRFLLERKIKNLQKLVQVKQSLVPDDFYNKAISSILSERDSLTDSTGIRVQVMTTLDSTYIKPEKKRRWRWFSKAEPDSILQVTVSHHTIIDSTNTNRVQNTDTVIHILQSVWQELQEHSENINQQINRQEYALISQSTYITDQLKRVLGEYEREEIHHSTYKIEQREKVVNATARIMAWIAIIAFLLILFFIFFILRDLSRSQRYRKELEAANQYADQLLKSREKMILTVTHDIKSPLSSVIGYIELLHHTPINERQRYYLKNMQGSAEHILKLVGNLLDLSKLENNKMTVEEVIFNPAQLFREIADNFFPLTTAKQLEFTWKFGQDLNKEYKGDALRIRQIITNILSNAVKYTAHGNIRFTANSTTDNHQMIIRIADTGSGMTTEEQKTIFEEFTRLKTHSAIEGTGLGLTITLKLIHLLEGKIKLESEPGKGSCFTIFLPLKHTSPETEVKATDTIPPNISPEINSIRILLVDDDPLQLEMTSSMLENNGIQTETTTQPAEVIEKLKQQPYDLIISDIQMPGMTGFELVSRIRNRQDSDTHTIPVIALSADSGRTAKDYLQAGFTAYLPKPFTTGQLLETIGKICRIEISAPLPSAPTSRPTGKTADGYTLKNILAFADQDAEALNHILSSFIQTTHEHLEQLKTGLREKNREDIARLAHKMLPVVRQLEAQQLIEPLQALEQAAKEPLPEKKMEQLTVRAIDETTALLQQIEQGFPYSIE